VTIIQNAQTAVWNMWLIKMLKVVVDTVANQMLVDTVANQLVVDTLANQLVVDIVANH